MKYTYKLGNIKLTPEMGEAVEKARPEGLNKQAMVREALALWLAAKTGSGVVPVERVSREEFEPRPPTPDYVIWWIPEGARRAVSRITLPNVRDEDGEVIETPPRYLDHIEDVFQVRARPRGKIFNAHRFPDVDLPDVERLQGRRPFAKFIWQESCAGLVVRGEDRNFLTDAPGFQSTLDLRQVTE